MPSDLGGGGLNGPFKGFGVSIGDVVFSVINQVEPEAVKNQFRASFINGLFGNTDKIAVVGHGSVHDLS